MEDAIDKKNLQDKIARTIIKRQNVHYMTIEEIEERERLERERKAAEEERIRLQNEKKLEKERSGKQKEIDEKSASDSADELTQGQIKQILGEREENIRHIVEQGEM